MSVKQTGVKARLLEETKTMLLLFVYLSLLSSAFTTYRRLILAQYGIGYLQYGYNFLEALVLAKVLVFGRILRLGDRFKDRPLIVPTLYKTLWFSVLVFAFSILEHLVAGWLHGQTSAVALDSLLDEGIWEILARTLVKLLALLPLCAVWEIGRVLGKGKLFELFFTKGSDLPGLQWEGNSGTSPEERPSTGDSPTVRDSKSEG
ncbi:MAG: hypothetical protein U0792_01530 [Gemmataceae bacterium]